MNKWMLGLSIIVIIALGAALLIPKVNATGEHIVVFKSQTCGCCTNYVSELRSQGFDVEVVPTQDMNEVKQRFNIPSSMESCHTSVIGGYFVEGHVPVGAIRELIAEQPAVSGIALPGMPSGSPGMPGQKLAPFRLYSLTNGSINGYNDV